MRFPILLTTLVLSPFACAITPEYSDAGETSRVEEQRANLAKATANAGSTTGPSYNEAGSPIQVSWSVRPRVAKVNIGSVAQWCEGNVFNEDHAHGVRNLVVNTKLLSPIEH